MTLRAPGRPARRRTLLAAAAAGALLATGCSSDSDDEAGTPAATPAESVTGSSVATPSTTAPATPAADEPVTVDPLTGEQTTLELAGAFEQALSLAQVELAAAGGAEGSGSTFSFPVTGGEATVAADGAPSGTVEHSGGLELTALGQSVTLQDFVVDLQAQSLTADVAGARIPLFSLEGGTPEVQDGQIVVDGADATLTGEAAQTLEDRLGVPLPQVSLGQVQLVLAGG